ncbi:MAG: alpha/beta hydrolase-fold protein [Elusimicrobiota bacterium]|jgi:enterochelin esterase family protein
MNGRLVVETVGSVVLKGNPLGDPRRREVQVYLPPSYLKDEKRRFPVLYYLPGFGSTSRSAVDPHPWKENLFDRFDRLVAEKKSPEAVLVVPDCFTILGGAQYMDSPATGDYEKHLVSELVPYVDARYRTAGRAVLGKSSGGYGALRLALLHPETFPHAGAHSPDLLFEVCYGRDIHKCVSALARWDHDFGRYYRDFRAARAKDAFPHELLNIAAMAACYSPDPKSPWGFALPFDPYTGELEPSVWARWKANDLLELAGRRPEGLRALKTLYFDCGSRDEFFLHLGARAFARRLKALGVRHRFEEHAGGHFDTAPRLDVSLPLLVRAAEGRSKAKK